MARDKLPQFRDEKAKTESGNDGSLSTASSCRVNCPPRRKMPSAWKSVLGLLVLSTVAFGLATASLPYRYPGDESNSDKSSSVLGQQESSLARLLHSYLPDTFRNCMNPSDVAESSGAIAKRQSNDTTSSSTITTSSIESTTTTSTTTQQSTTTTTSTQDTTTSTTSTTETTPTITTTTSTQPTTPSTTTTETTITTTQSSSTPDTTLSTATSPGKTGGTTSHVTSIYTSTLAGGGVTTITSVAIVTNSGTTPTSTSSGEGRLQTGAAVALHRQPILEVAFGVMLGGALMV
ncbi:hypothetical protein BX600DRAFT_292326 [Xylariales sp. PMI_506]|nr:hypothetical protein BX600DRAFT_292326 [Xylariales sp. PMI_506]